MIRAHNELIRNMRYCFKKNFVVSHTQKMFVGFNTWKMLERPEDVLALDLDGMAPAVVMVFRVFEDLPGVRTFFQMCKPTSCGRV